MLRCNTSYTNPLKVVVGLIFFLKILFVENYLILIDYYLSPKFKKKKN